MDKSILKTVINGLTQGQHVTFNFVGSGLTYQGRTYASGEYTVAKIKTGRGKGGSRVVELIAADGGRFITGTVDSNRIVNVVVDGVMSGYESEADIPLSYERNPVAAARLKEGLRKLVGRQGRTFVQIDSSVPDFNGEFELVSANLMRGRTGQVRLVLSRDEQNVEIWSLRHSGVVTGVRVFVDGGTETLF